MHCSGNCKTIRVNDVSQDERYIAPSHKEGRPRSLLVVPVKTGNQSLGTLSVQIVSIGAFTLDDERLLTILGT